MKDYKKGLIKRLEKDAIRLLKVSKDNQELISDTKRLPTEQALEVMLGNPTFIDPLIFTLVAHDNGVAEKLNHAQYCEIMRQKALRSRNMKLVMEIDKVKGLLR